MSSSKPSSPHVSRETKETETTTFSYRWLTDRGLLLKTGDATGRLFHRLLAAGLSGVEEIVPADGSLLVVLEPGCLVPEGLLSMLGRGAQDEATRSGKLHRIPIHFDGEDLGEAAALANMPEQTLISCLLKVELSVKFLGFQPGFAYLEGLPPALCLPRRSTPRKRVPAGSLALGGGYCGIYPAAGPGGWYLLGHTTIALFDASRQPPARLQTGDRISLELA